MSPRPGGVLAGNSILVKVQVKVFEEYSTGCIDPTEKTDRDGLVRRLNGYPAENRGPDACIP